MSETTEVEKGMSIFLDVFRRADKKDDGKISWEEFVAFFADGVMSKEELRKLFEEIDTHKTNYIDPKELCDYFSKHLGQFKEILSLVEDLNTKVSNMLLSTSKTYPEKSRSDQFISRFLMGLVMDQVCALQRPLDSATEALDEQAKNERTDIVPVQVEDVREKSKEQSIVPGRVVRRAKRQTSSQNSYEGQQALGSTQAALNSQVDRLSSLLDRLEKRVNFDGIVDEEVDVTEDKKVILYQLDMAIKSGQEQSFKTSMRDYIEATNAAPGCLNVTVRSFKDSNKFTMYEVWTSDDNQTKHAGSSAGQAFKKSLTDNTDNPGQPRSVAIPASWWSRDQ
ncbi:N-terminal EF-hand calcium-binding protein 1-like [Ruditapes philippinarum]|uniref:N-terminal EF-hand calcium-binding protein 1-like n=1 Tax=Ruditapes philippinarum TaxID=129788 RepID=UPI00295AB76D|nr:N-terminal EF-hand calcium-binding protein 1-like [Ruditapes philippinarum]